MPRLGVSCIRGKMSDEECRACIAEHNGVTPCHIPAPLLEMMRGSDGEPSHDSFTPSRLLGCFRQPTLMNEEPYWTNVEHAWAMVRGTLIHSGIESAGWPGVDDKDIVREARMVTTVHTAHGPQRFTGKADCIILHDHDGYTEIDVWDWKTREFKNDLTEPDRAHQMQVWMYAWLAARCIPDWHAERQDVRVRSVNIAYISSSGCRIFTNLTQPSANVTRGRGKDRHKEELPLEAIKTFDLDTVGRFIRSRIEAKIRARTELPDMLEGDAATFCFRCPVYGACKARGNVRKELAA